MNNTKYGFTFSYTEKCLFVYVMKETRWYSTKREMVNAAKVIQHCYENDPNFSIKYKIKKQLTH